MKNFLKGATILLSVLFMQSCQKDFLALDQSTTNPINSTIINSNKEALKERVNYNKLGLLPIQIASAKLRSNAAPATSSWFLPSDKSTSSLSFVAEIASITFDSKILSATHVAVDGDYAYVAYTTKGEEYYGGIQIINISNIDVPVVEREIILNGYDVNAIEVDQGNLLLSGAVDINKKEGLTSPAWFTSFSLNEIISGQIDFDNSYQVFTGNVALDIASNSTSNYVVSGSNGVIAKFNKASNKVDVEISVSDLRSIYSNDNLVITLSGTEGIRIYNQNLDFIRALSLSKDVVESKRTIDFYNDRLYVSQGKLGFGVYDINLSSHQLEKIPAHAIDENVEEEDRVTNAVSVNGDKVFAANGGVGVSIYTVNTSNDLTYLGTIKSSNIGGSSNFVVSKEDYILIASGQAGLKILKLTEHNTSPNIPSCNGEYPKYVKTQDWEEYGFNLNSGEVKSYSGNTTFTKEYASINLNDGAHLTWCGELNLVNFNSNSRSIFDMFGKLSLHRLHVNGKVNINGTATLEKELTVNSGGVLNANGTVIVGKSGQGNTWSHVNGELVIKGEMILYSNLTINSGAKITLLDNAKLTVYGDLTNNGNVVGGTIKTISK